MRHSRLSYSTSRNAGCNDYFNASALPQSIAFLFMLSSILRRAKALIFNRLRFERRLSAIVTEASYAVEDDGRLEVCRKLAQGVSYVYASGVQGDFAEFGTMTGMTAAALSVAINGCSKRFAMSELMHGFTAGRDLYLFDSFEGLPRSSRDEDRLSPHVSSGVWGKGACKGLTPDKLLSVCSRYLDRARIHVIKGWFKHTVQPTISSPLALIHVDGDLYESAMDALDPLFENGLISSGALIFFDDYNCNRSDPAFGERKAWVDLVSKYNIIFSDQGHYAIVGHQFIVHAYSCASCA